MFFLREDERTITIHPSFLGPNIHRYIRDQLFKDVEGTNTGHYFIICVMDSYEISEGRVIPGSSFSEYTVHFRAIIWKPFKGEVVDGTVRSITESGFFVGVGPMDMFVSKTMIPSDMVYNGNATPPQWTNNGDQVIEKGTVVRVRVKGTREDAGKMYAIATIKEDYLGLLGE